VKYDDAHALFVKWYMMQHLRLCVADADGRARENGVCDADLHVILSSKPKPEPAAAPEPDPLALFTRLSAWNKDMITRLLEYSNEHNDEVDGQLSASNWFDGVGVEDTDVSGMHDLIATATLEFSTWLTKQKYRRKDRARVEHKLETLRLFVLTLQLCIGVSAKTLASKYARDFQILYVSFAFAVWMDLFVTDDLLSKMSTMYKYWNMLYVYIRYRIVLAQLVGDFLVDKKSINAYRVSTEENPAEIAEYETIRSHYDQHMKLIDGAYTQDKPRQPRTGDGNAYNARQPSPERPKNVRPTNPNAYIPPNRQGGYVPKNSPNDATAATDATDATHIKPAVYRPPHVQRKNAPAATSAGRTRTHRV
jgi:hypothetical protein